MHSLPPNLHIHSLLPNLHIHSLPPDLHMPTLPTSLSLSLSVQVIRSVSFSTLGDMVAVGSNSRSLQIFSVTPLLEAEKAIRWGHTPPHPPSSLLTLPTTAPRISSSTISLATTRDPSTAWRGGETHSWPQAQMIRSSDYCISRRRGSLSHRDISRGSSVLSESSSSCHLVIFSPVGQGTMP